MARNLIGTGADQVSVNGMLGELAFQTKENVNFTGGTGKLSKLDIDAISAQLNVSAVDVFVYDTRKDSDGGAWRKRCQNTSWYNETLNTSTRGSRREFPSVAVIVVTSASVTIYDADDATLPMWMVFNRGVDANPTNWWDGNNANTGTSVCAVNGFMILGTYAAGAYGADFIGDRSSINYTSSTNSGYRNNGALVNRNSGTVIRTTYIQPYDNGINQYVNDIAITVLPNAPIDSVTGLPTPTIALGTNNGTSVIKDNGKVFVLYGSNWGAMGRAVAFDKNGLLYFSQNSYYWLSCDVKALTQSYTNLVDGRDYYQVEVDTYPIKQVSCYDGNSWSASISPAVSAGNDFHIAHAGSYLAPFGRIVRHYIDKTTDNSYQGNNHLMNYIGLKYNTGWMPGAVKGTWLSDTTPETIVSNQLVSNPGPSFTNTTGWYLDAGNSAGSSLSVSSGKIVFTHGSTNNYWDGFGFSFPVIAGKTYTVVADIASVTNMNVLRVSINDPGQHNEQYTGSISAGINQLTFIAAASGTAYAHWNGYLTSSTMQVNSVSVRIADADRTVNNRGMQVFGTITKTPVAVGAELMAYSNFSSTNYLEQQYTGLFDFGTGSFSFSGWVKINAHQYQGIAEYSRPGVDSDGSILLFATTTGTLEFYTRSNGGGWSFIISPTLTTGTWIHLCCTRDTLGNKKIYVNGVFAAGGNDGALNVTATGYSPRIGFGSRVDGNATRQPLNGSLALWKVSATAPSDAMVAKMYNDEKQLFQENAKATLYGTSDNVVALAYDQDTNLLHAGTSSGRSVFQGMCRVDNTTTAVSTSISASNGLVAEQ